MTYTLKEPVSDNLAETILLNMPDVKQVLSGYPALPNDVTVFAVPEKYKLETLDFEKYLPRPRRKKIGVIFDDTDSFIQYLKRYGSFSKTTVYCNFDPEKSLFRFEAYLDDQGEEEHETSWRSHLAQYIPVQSVEWRRWLKSNRQPFTQAEFATFIEDNKTDIASATGFPTGEQIYQMALQFEARQEMVLKSHIRLENGTIEMQFIDKEDAATGQKMQLFSRFAIGLPAFRGGNPYQIEARLRYRTAGGKLAFWYELIRPDRIFEDAARALITQVSEGAGVPFFLGVTTPN